MKTFLCFDTETTDLDKPDACDLILQPHITEIYCVKFDKKFNVIDEFGTLFNVPVKLDDHITKITGITDEMLEDQPKFFQKYKELAKFFTGVDCAVGHNITFDMNMLRYEVKRIGKDFYFPWPRQRLCTVEASYPIMNKRLKLGLLYEMATGKVLKGSHRSKADVIGTMECMKWLKKENLI